MSHRLTKEELDEQFELFLKESVSDDSVELAGIEKQPRAKRSHKSALKPAAPWWQEDEHSDGGTERTRSRFLKSKRSQPERDGTLSSAESLRKTLKKSHSIQEEDEDPEGLEAAFLSRENTETQDSGMVRAVNMMGLDTLEEEEEKANFFTQLEAGASTTIDYSKLNRELDSTTSTIGINLGKAEDAVDQSDDHQRKTSIAELTTSPDKNSLHYSEDFEEEEKEEEQQEEKTKVSPIIAKVSLYDSLDDTGEEDRGKDTAGSLNKGQSYVQTGSSEIEALHEAYREIHVVKDSDDHNHCNASVEGRGRIHRPMSPSSPHQHDGQSLQPASTIESELPTAEELMRPIRPENEHMRGFSLQAVSAAELDEKTSHSFERTFSELTRPGNADPVPERKTSKGLTSQASSSSDHPDRNLTWSVREEVERLMEDHDKSSPYVSSQAGKVKKQPVSCSSNVSRPSTSSVKKPSVTPVRGRRLEGRTTVTSRSSGMTRAAATNKTASPQNLFRHRSTTIQEKDDHTEPSLKVSSELVASVQSLVSVLQQQVDTSSHQETRLTHHLPTYNREENSSVVEELRDQLAQKEKELQMMKEGAEELNSLRQHNYLLQSKLRSAEEANQKKKWAEAKDPETEEKLRQIDKEMKEQETLIKGYQQENERLYSQMKAQQAKSKANEEAMFKENQRLLNELEFTREQMNKTVRPVGNVCLVDHTQRIADLLAQINTFQRNEAKLYEDIHRLKQEKQALDVDLRLMKKERDLARVQVSSTSGAKSFEMCVLEDKHREEVSALKKKLQWFAENQQLLDRDAGRLKAASAEIQQLKDQVEKLKMQVGKRSSEQPVKSKDRSVDTKRMQHLERQVKELEHILRHRNPNSLPALIYAAASAGGEDDVDTAKTSAPNHVTALERRIQHLEAELETHDEEATKNLRAMEQRFHSVKLRYEEQISELEEQLKQKQHFEVISSSPGTKATTSQVETLEKELEQVKETHQKKEKSLHDQIESLQQQLKNKAQPSPGRLQRQTEAAFGVRIERLNQELAVKTRTIQELSRTVERLQKERRSMLSLSSPRPETHSTETKRQPGPTKTLCSASTTDTSEGEKTFPAAQYEKTYQPTVFEGSHISEVQQENEALRQQLEQLQQQSEQEKEALKADALQAKQELSRLKEQTAEQLSSMKTEHVRLAEQLCAAHALEHSSSKVAELTNKVNTQEITVKHLQTQLKELQGAKDELAISRTRENALQKQLTRLLKELKDAKEAQSPEVKLLCSLEKKILNMELRHQHREKELTQVIGGSWQMMEANQQSEVEQWKRLAQDRSRQLEAFRLELDAILDILRHLQRQGLVLSPPDAPITAPIT